MSSNPKRDFIIAGVIIPICAICIGMIALIPAFGAWWFPREAKVITQPSATLVANNDSPTPRETSPVDSNPITQIPTNTPLEEPTIAPTNTIIPTEIPQPTAPITINTAPDSILDVGQSWQQDDLLLTLGEVNYNPNFPESECDISFGFYVENSSSSNTINISVKPSQVQAVDNLGRSLQRAGFSEMSICPAGHIIEPFSGIVEPEKRFPSSDNWQAGYTINLTDPALDYIIVTVNGLYHFNNAKWKIPINN